MRMIWTYFCLAAGSLCSGALFTVASPFTLCARPTVMCIGQAVPFFAVFFEPNKELIRASNICFYHLYSLVLSKTF